MKVIALSNGKAAVVSNCDYAYLRRWTWTLDVSTGYAVRYINRDDCREKHYMHLAIAKRAKRRGGQQIDHSDRNTLNNQRCNLRVSTFTGQHANRMKQRNNTSGFKGVFWHKPTRKWMAQIGVQCRHIYLGLFASRRNAALAYNQAARTHFGKFACLNKV